MVFARRWVSSLFALALSLSLHAADADPKAPAPPSYAEFLGNFVKPDMLADFIKRSDTLIDAVDGPRGVGEGLASDTQCGVHLEFRVIPSEEAVVYYLLVSRNGAELHYSDAVKIASLFADRAALGHPIDVTEGEKPVFHCQWLYKPSDWKKMRPKMQAWRQHERTLNNPQRLLSSAIEREMRARSSAQNH